MDKALVQNSQHNVDDKDGHQQQQAESAERRFECLRRSLKAGSDRLRQKLCRLTVDGSNSIAQRHTGPQIEADGHGWKLPEVSHAEWSYLAAENCDTAQGHKLAGPGMDIEHAQR